MSLHAVDIRTRIFVRESQEFARLMGASLVGMRDLWHLRRQVVEAMITFGSQSAWLVMLAALFLGLVLALEWGTKLEPFGAKLLMGRIVAVAVVREIGPMITGLMVAGRTGAKMAAEIGSMKMTDQIDALRALGMDPVSRLVTPRVVACTLTMFPLTLLADAVAILGGWFVAIQWLDISSHFYWTAAIDSLSFKDLAVGYVKPFVFGYMIATITAYFGMSTTGGSAGVGTSATRAVMFSSLSILIMDFVLGKLVLAVFGS